MTNARNNSSELRQLRADVFLVEAGFFESRSAAQAAISTGRVSADGVVVTRASQKIPAGSVIEANAAHPYVSRGGMKLAHGLESFGVSAAGKVCLDLGASTGGFTDVLLQRGAIHVTAVDVGTGQLHARLATDGRVNNLQQRDARSLTPGDLPAPPSLIVGDLSFVGLEKALATPLSLASPAADLLVLFKPQFQVGRANIGRGGLVRNAAATRAAESRFAQWLAGAGWPVLGWTDSPIRGGDGNHERLVHAKQSR
ncbi:MAG: TlyA family RNA methyltransferase [Pseudomonadota bacterium]